MTQKRILIDKCAFMAASLPQLRTLAASGSLVLPEVLWYECLTSDQSLDILKSRLLDVFRAGAYVCPSIETLIAWEAENLRPYGSIVLGHEDCGVRLDQSMESRRQRYDEFAMQFTTVPKGFHEKLLSEDYQLLSDVRKWDSSKRSRTDRLRRWVETVDGEDMHQWSYSLFAGITESPRRFCLSADWIAWHFLRMAGAIMLEQTFLTHCGGGSGKREAEHDLQDIFYVTLLCRVDGLLTMDKKLVEPLARAAFPEKDVFSSLEEVPKSYRCDWTNS